MRGVFFTSVFQITVVYYLSVADVVRDPLLPGIPSYARERERMCVSVFQRLWWKALWDELSVKPGIYLPSVMKTDTGLSGQRLNRFNSMHNADVTRGKHFLPEIGSGVWFANGSQAPFIKVRNTCPTYDSGVVARMWLTSLLCVKYLKSRVNFSWKKVSFESYVGGVLFVCYCGLLIIKKKSIWVTYGSL